LPVIQPLFVVAVLLLTTNTAKAVAAVASGEDPSQFRSCLDAVEFLNAFQLIEKSRNTGQ